jgi:hypothetical protein
MARVQGKKAKAKARPEPKTRQPARGTSKAKDVDPHDSVTAASLAALERVVLDAARKVVQPTSTAGFELDDDWLGGDVSFELVVDGVAVELPGVDDAWSAYLAARDQIVTACQAAYDELEAKNPMAQALVTGKPWKPTVAENKRLREVLVAVLAALKAEKRIATAAKMAPVSGS